VTGQPLITVTVDVGFTFAGLTLKGKVFTLTAPLPGLLAAQGADTALTAEVAKYIADTATAIQDALNTEGDSDAAVQQIATDMLAASAALVAADPLNPPAGSSTSTATLPGT
jgi:hypothetical protein